MLEFAPTSPDADVPYVRRTLAALVRRVELDPQARTARVQYSVGLGGLSWRPHRDSHGSLVLYGCP